MNAPATGLLAAPVEAALIDLDGTLLHTAPDLAAAANRMLVSMGRDELDLDLLTRYIGKGIRAMVHRALTLDMDGQADPELFERAHTFMEQYYREESGRQAVAYPGVVDGLQDLRAANVRVACVTNKTARFTHELLDRTGLAPYFDLVICGDTLARRKPDPLPFTHACEVFGVPPARTVVIGDSYNDVVAGLGAGSTVIAVSYGYNEGRPISESGPHLIVDAFGHATDLVVATRKPEPVMDPADAALVARFAQIVGDDHVLVREHDQEPYAIDWRRKFFGRPLAVVRPKSAEEVARIVRVCNEALVGIVPQGGNTGLCGGGTPDGSGRQVIVSLTRMNRVRSIDTANNTMVVEAGVPLARVQEAAREAGRLFPLSLASEGTCAIGGNLSTNAGGVAVLRYGNTRELTLGLEVVLPDGEIWDGLRGLRKDNTGYDLKQLFIGAEGTLGIITAAVVKLFPLPVGRAVFMAALDTAGKAIELLAYMQTKCGERLTGFELLSEICIALVCKHHPDAQRPFADIHPQYVVAELSDTQSVDAVRTLAESALEGALEAGIIRDAVVASSEAQAKALWALRENISEAQQREGPNIKHDVTIPASSIADFIATTDREMREAFPGVQLLTFGHLGDGNLHYNVSAPQDADAAQFTKASQDQVNLIVHDSVARYRGSMSAEHGIGQLKRAEMERYKSPVEMAVMRRIKAAIDPLGLMNPGKVV